MLRRPQRTELVDDGERLLDELQALVRAARKGRAPEAFVFAVRHASATLQFGLREVGSAVPEQKVTRKAASQIATAMVDSMTAAECSGEPSTGAAEPQPALPGDALPTNELRGTIEVLPLTELLELLRHQRKTGILTIALPGEVATLELVSGRLVHASSDNSPAGERLGDILVTRGFLTDEQLDEHLEVARAAGQRLGTALEEDSILTKTQLLEALSEQVQRLFHRLFDAERGSFRFSERGAECGDRRVDLDLRQLLFESARHSDESLVDDLRLPGDDADGPREA